jgi:hypothetical protein
MRTSVGPSAVLSHFSGLLTGQRFEEVNMAGQVWREAADIIGAGADDDYQIRPVAQAEVYAERAPALSEILQRNATRIAAEDFERSDAEATRTQTEFKRAANRANVSVLAIAIVAAGLMVLALVDAPALTLLGLGLAGGATGAYAAYLTQRLKQTQMFERWMSARADAEERRREYFDLVTEVERTPSETAGSPPLPLLQFEYFRRYHLDVQIRYYAERQQMHQRQADRTATFAAFAVFLAALFTGVGGAMAGGLGPEWSAVAALGILGAALTSFATTRESIGQDERNAERYARTRTALRHLSGRLDDVREAVSAGNHASLREFVAAVSEQVSVEHRQWLSDTQSTRAGMLRLEEALRASPPMSSHNPPG